MDFPTELLRYPDWKAPAEDGQILVWPHPPEFVQQTLDNHLRLSEAEARVCDRPLRDWRQSMRRWLGHANDAQPLIATGHQTELYHPGVWVKNVLINVVAEKVGGGAAYHVSVDTDEPKHLQVRWLGGSAPVTDDPNLNTAAWSGLLDAPSPAHVQQVESEFEDAAKSWDFQPVMPEFLRSLRRLALEQPRLPDAITSALHELEWSLGLRHHALLASPIWTSEPFAAFAMHIVRRPAEFAQAYNAALAEYRAENKIKTPARPMPDLVVGEDECEVPFWLDDLQSGTRQRARVRRVNDRWVLPLRDGIEYSLDGGGDGDHVAGPDSLARILRELNLRLSPRAITLTMFLRLFVADQFVHGIGGGRYDQVTDRIIRSFFDMCPPAFSVTTATLYFPTSVHRQPACLACVVQEGHHLKHSLLGEEKMQYVRAIEQAPRHSPQRYRMFQQMHHLLAGAAAGNPELHRWRQTLEQTLQQVNEDKVLFDRELFFAVQSRQRLLSMIAPYRELFEM